MRALRLLVVGLLICPVAAAAAPVTYSGYLDSALSLSPSGGELQDYLLGPPDLVTFPDQNVALFEFTIASPTAVSVKSLGYNDLFGNTPNVDGFDAYVAIFQGSGNTASFLYEFFNPVAPGDFEDVTGVLATGVYTLAVTMWNNYACGNGACAGSTGTLGDGFSGLSNLDPLRALYFEIALDARSTPVPEPSSLLLLGTASFGLALRLRRRR